MCAPNISVQQSVNKSVCALVGGGPVPPAGRTALWLLGFAGKTQTRFPTCAGAAGQAQNAKQNAAAEQERSELIEKLEEALVEVSVAKGVAREAKRETMDERWERLMETQHRISTEKMRAKVGRVLDVIIDEVGDGGAVGRTKGDAPEIDGTVAVENVGGVDVGDIIAVKITEADDYDLTGILAY